MIAAKADAEAGENNGGSRRVVLDRALAVGEQLIAALRAHPASDRVELAGSARRMTDSVKDLDIIATASDPGALARAAAELELVEAAQKPGEPGCGCGPIPGSRSTCGSSPRISSAT